MSSPARILIADDDPVFRNTLAAFLGKVGYECVCAPDSASALEILGASEFDLLLSDLAMPGNENMAFIRQIPKRAPGLPVILLTAHPTMESAAQSVRLPVVAYLVKPPNLEELQEVAGQAVERYNTYRAVTGSRERLEKWLTGLKGIQELLSGSEGPSAAVPASEYLALTFRNLVLSLGDLKQMIQAVAGQEGKDDVLSRVALVDALRQTIEVLARTRQSFKSKELGELRRKLEELLGGL